MPEDTYDLLIFKMRGIQRTKVDEEKEAQKPAHAEDKDLPMVIKEEVPILQKSKVQQPAQKEAAAQVVEKSPAQPESKKTGKEGESIQKFLDERIGEQQETIGKKFTKNERANIRAARGLNCTNHPWRPAYATCDYCRRAFCYADLVSFGKSFYCLEDIDRVSSKSAREGAKVSRMLLNAVGALFILSTAVLAYFVVPQVNLIYLQVQRSGLGFFFALNYAYILLIVNTILVVLGLAAAVMIFIKHDNGLFIAGSVAAVTIIVLSYEYLTTNAFYLLFITLIEIVDIAALAYGRMNMVEESYEHELAPMDIEWPSIVQERF